MRVFLALLCVSAVSLFTSEARADGEDEPATEEPLGPPRPPAPPPVAWPTSPEEKAVAPGDVAVVPATPHLPTERRFGGPGQVVLSSSLGGYASSYSESEAQYFGITVGPGADYFIVENISIGAELLAEYTSARGYGADGSLVETTQSTIAGGARFGVNLPLGDVVSFYPRIAGGLESVHATTEVVRGRSASIAASPIGAPSTTLVGPYVFAFLPLLVHPKPHLFFGIGPTFFHEFGRTQVEPSIGGERTTVAGRLIVGGWFGGRDSEAESAPVVVAARPRFGSEGQWVFTADAGASFASTTYGGVDAPRTTFRVSPGFDYFVLDHFAAGLGVSGSYGSYVGHQPDGSRVETTASGVRGVARLSADIPLGTSFSWYVRGSIAYGNKSNKQVTGRDVYDVDVESVDVGLYAPVLAHLATHYFVGFGPYVSQDLKSTASTGGPDNLGSTVGADLIVGGWL